MESNILEYWRVLLFSCRKLSGEIQDQRASGAGGSLKAEGSQIQRLLLIRTIYTNKNEVFLHTLSTFSPWLLAAWTGWPLISDVLHAIVCALCASTWPSLLSVAKTLLSLSLVSRCKGMPSKKRNDLKPLQGTRYLKFNRLRLTWASVMGFFIDWKLTERLILRKPGLEGKATEI